MQMLNSVSLDVMTMLTVLTILLDIRVSAERTTLVRTQLLGFALVQVSSDTS